LAEILIYDCVKVDPRPDADANAYEQLRLVEGSSGEITVADGQLQSCGGLGAFGLEGLFWSPNSRYFYYTNAREGVPDGCGGYWQKPILRLEINTLRTENLGAGFLSPDGTKIAARQGNELVIWDVNEGTEAGAISPIVLNTETETGPIVWSPDSQALVYIQAQSYCPVSGKSAVVHVTLSTLRQEILLESDSPTFGDADWNKNNILVLFDENGNQWVYTFDTQELEPLP
jgi:Tol biopolymer transport system component